MCKKLNRYLAVLVLAFTMVIGSAQAVMAENNPVVETITLDESLVWDSDMPVDISWKTKQDHGQWIEELGIARDAKSLILVINNLDKEDTDAIPAYVSGADLENTPESKKAIIEAHRLDGKSKLSYFSKDEDGKWSEVFSVECFISGGMMFEKEDVYGVYEPTSTFGILGNPGSLLSYRILGSDDYWSVNPEDPNFGKIFTPEKAYLKPENAVNLRGLKSYANYGMILNPEDDYSSCPPIVINCMQMETNDGILSGIHMPEDQLRMMIQSIDQETKFVITNSLSELETM